MTRRIALVTFSLILAITNSLPAAAFTLYDFYGSSDIEHYDKNADPLSTCVVAPGSGGAATGNVPTNFSLGTDPKERRVNLMKALIVDYGLTPAQAAGPVGNFMAESGGAHLPPNVNEGGRAGPPAFRGGYGWAQWTGGRQRTFIDYAVANSYMTSRSVDATDAANYAYLKKELAEGYTVTITDLKKQSDPEQAAVSFERTFEKAGIPRLEARRANARQAFNEYMETASGGGPSVTPNAAVCGTQPGGAAIAGDFAFPLIGTKSVVKNPGMFRNNTADLAGHPYTAYDILADPGTPVAAFMSGTVTSISQDRCPGRLISVYNADQDIVVSYLHLAFQSQVREGDTITQGQRIGVVGGASEGCGTPHLHIDAVKGRVRVGCSRLSCPATNKAKFLDIGPQLYQTFQALPN